MKKTSTNTSKGDFIIYVSGLDYPSKNHLWLLDEYAKLVGNGLKSKLYLVGNAHPNSLHLAKIEKRIQELHLEDMVFVKQNVTNLELEELYRSCLFSVFPSKYEGFGRPIIESINYGKDVYCTDVGIYQEVKDNSLVHPFHEIHKRAAMNKIRILNINFNNISEDEFFERCNKGLVITPNVDFFIINQKDKEFHQILNESEYVLCDSQLIYIGSKFLGRPLKEKLSGSDVFPRYCQFHRNNPDVKIFLMGGMPGVAEKAAQNLNQKTGRDIIVDIIHLSLDTSTPRMKLKK